MYTRHNEIRLLFDDTILSLKASRGDHFREQQTFFEVLGEKPETHAVFLKFLHDVSTCPIEIIAWCQNQLNAKVRNIA